MSTATSTEPPTAEVAATAEVATTTVTRRWQGASAIVKGFKLQWPGLQFTRPTLNGTKQFVNQTRIGATRLANRTRIGATRFAKQTRAAARRGAVVIQFVGGVMTQAGGRLSQAGHNVELLLQPSADDPVLQEDTLATEEAEAAEGGKLPAEVEATEEKVEEGKPSEVEATEEKVEEGKPSEAEAIKDKDGLDAALEDTIASMLGSTGHVSGC